MMEDIGYNLCFYLIWDVIIDTDSISLPTEKQYRL